MALIHLEPTMGRELVCRIRINQFPEGVTFSSILAECVDSFPYEARPLLRDTFLALREHNKSTYDAHSQHGISLLLDGRKKRFREGFLGDLIESTRIVNTLHTVGKPLKLLKPARELLAAEPLIEVVDLSQNTPMKWHSPCNCGNRSASPFHREVKLAAGANSLIAVPTICRIPHWLGVNAAVPHADAASHLDGIFSVNRSRIAVRDKRIWTNAQNMNQVHAHQVWLYLLGVLDKPQPLSLPYITKDANNLAIAEIVGRDVPANATLVMIHIGTAGETSKLWPKDKWRELINRLIVGRPDVFICFIWPTDSSQQKTTCELITAIGEFPNVLRFRYPITLRQLIHNLRHLVSYFHSTPLLIGVDSLPAGHLYPALGGRAIVIGNRNRNDFHFSCPADLSASSFLVLPPDAVRRNAAEYVEVDDVQLAVDASLQ